MGFRETPLDFMKNMVLKVHQEIKLFLKEEINNPNFVKVIADKNDYAIYFSRYAIPFARNEIGFQWYKHIGIYAYRKKFLLEYYRW